MVEQSVDDKSNEPKKAQFTACTVYVTVQAHGTW